jgi:hypothetical protein
MVKDSGEGTPSELDLETECRRDEALRRALAMPPLAKPKRQGSVQRALTEIIQEARDGRAEIAALRADRDGRSDP